MQNRPFLLAALLFIVPMPACADAESDVQQVVDRFRAAIVAKDAPALHALFLDGHDSWFSVDTDAEHARRLAGNPQVQRVEPG